VKENEDNKLKFCLNTIEVSLAVLISETVIVDKIGDIRSRASDQDVLKRNITAPY
jgi:hypothetical protein